MLSYVCTACRNPNKEEFQVGSSKLASSLFPPEPKPLPIPPSCTPLLSNIALAPFTASLQLIEANYVDEEKC